MTNQVMTKIKETDLFLRPDIEVDENGKAKLGFSLEDYKLYERVGDEWVESSRYMAQEDGSIVPVGGNTGGNMEGGETSSVSPQSLRNNGGGSQKIGGMAVDLTQDNFYS